MPAELLIDVIRSVAGKISQSLYCLAVHFRCREVEDDSILLDPNLSCKASLTLYHSRLLLLASSYILANTTQPSPYLHPLSKKH